MNRLARFFPPSPRLRAASGRLRAAETGFELSMTDLRRAALEQVDCHRLLGIALRASLQPPVLHGEGRS
ncbi:hypothetical protein IPV08_03695 [Methylobacterium sp. SD274]|uniref:hypothetical protein n=1 Tax=Methylobacterium sp. SD274 TaxID=2782009 RepID=UPI001A97852A|nr:hypothetical protein [Methylobacterium sp. SD274]MBO1019072.1 hypothetical protein [Methylobacterium sp. SD274]